MLNFWKVNIVFGILLILSIVARGVYQIPIFTHVFIVLVYSLVLFYGCYYIGSNFFIKVVCSAETSEKVIAISFDDGPDATTTPRILQILKDHHSEAAFFCIGKNISGNEDLLKYINTQGHIIGNHSFSHHFWFDMFSADEMATDLQAMDDAMFTVTGKKPALFRPPYGVTNPNLAKAITSGRYAPIGWNVRSMDTVITNENKLLNKVVSGIKPGAIFLFHDTSQATIAILPAFIKHVKAAGYQIVRLDKMLNINAYA